LGRAAVSLDLGHAVREHLAHAEPASTRPNHINRDGALPQTPSVRVNSASLKPQGISTEPPHPTDGVEFNRLFVAAQRDKKSSSLGGRSSVSRRLAISIVCDNIASTWRRI
jgi:hypothetical protein